MTKAYGNSGFDSDTSQLVSDEESGSDLQSSDPSSTPPTEASQHNSADAEQCLPRESTRKRGAPKGNKNALRNHSRGSKMPDDCKNEYNHVTDFVRRTANEWRAKYGDGPMPVSADILLHQIRRAVERDRVAAKLLHTLKDLK